MAGSRVFAFECRARGADHGSIVHHVSAHKARYEYLLDMRDVWPDMRYIDVRVRKLGAPVTSSEFLRTAAYRGLPDLRVGQEVLVQSGCVEARGVVVGHNASANFDVLFDDAAGDWAGKILNVHPCEMRAAGAEVGYE